jgi:hypothetical protein
MVSLPPEGTVAWRCSSSDVELGAFNPGELHFDGQGRVESTSARDALVSIGRCPQAGSACGIAQASFEVFCEEFRLNLQGLLRFRQ